MKTPINKLPINKLLMAGATVLTLGVNAQAATWSFENDYVPEGLSGGGAVNPGRVWSLMFQPSGAETDRTGSYSLMGFHTTDYLGLGLDAWQRNSGTALPGIGVNTTGADQFGFLPAGQSFVLPGSPTISIIRWTAPATAIYDISYIFTDLQGGGDGSDVYVNQSGTDLFGAVIGDTGTTGLGSISNVALNAGDNIDWIVGAGLSGDNAADVVRVFAEVQTVPEPSAIALGLLGLVALATARRRSLLS